MEEEIFQLLLNRCYKYIAIRPRTKKEFLEYINKKISYKKIDDGTKTRILKKVTTLLEQENLINDIEFIEWWIEQRSSFRPRSKRMLIQELMLKGISKEDLEIYFSEHEIDDVEQAKKLIRKKKYLYKDKGKKEYKNKIITYLVSRGFSYQSAKKAIEE